MRDLVQIANMTDAELTRFREIVRYLLGGRCFTRGDKAEAEERWRFILKYHGIFAAYFEAADWEFELRDDLGAALARPRHRRHAHLFSPVQSHFVYHLLAYHYESVTGEDLDRARAEITYGELMERVQRTLPPGTNMNRTSLEKAWRKLKDFGAIDLSRGFSGMPSDVITIHPVIELVLPRSVVEAQIRALQPTDGDLIEPFNTEADAAEVADA